MTKDNPAISSICLHQKYRRCRFCGARLSKVFVDLGMSPLCETYITESQLSKGETYYPLRAFVCEQCWLVQLEEFVKADKIFDEYAYFSSYSESWLRHCEKYCAQMKRRFSLNQSSYVLEVASNDGYLLQYFAKDGIPVMGIEPAKNVACVAQNNGIPTLVAYFDKDVANRLVREGRKADLVVGNNVLAQVPNLNEFVEGLKIVLEPEGVLTLEFPQLLRMIKEKEFDTIYHEHFSYFSLITITQIMETHGLRVFDVEELKSHGGSLRILACHEQSKVHMCTSNVERVKKDELDAGLDTYKGYETFAQHIKETKQDLVHFLLDASRSGKKVCGYGAPGKSSTLLHYCGIGKDLIEYTVDRNPYKQGRYLPGCHIPIYNPSYIREAKPDYIIIFPWNLKNEIIAQLQYIREWGGKFVVPIPDVTFC